MPPALPANTTPRIVVSYSSSGFEHTLTLRTRIGALTADHLAMARTLCNALASKIHVGNSFNSAEFIAAGTLFGVPMPWAPIAGLFAGAFFTEDPESAFVSVTGRSLGGHRVRWDLFTTAAFFAPWPTTNRVDGAADPAAASILAAFNAALTDPSAPLTAIDGLDTLAHAYVNIAKNSHFQRAQR